MPLQASDKGGTSPPPRVEKSWKEINRGTIVTILGTRVDGTALNNDGPTQSNRGRVAVSFRIGNSNKGRKGKCGAISGRHSPSCQTKYYIEQKQHKHEQTKRIEKEVHVPWQGTSLKGPGCRHSLEWQAAKSVLIGKAQTRRVPRLSVKINEESNGHTTRTRKQLT